MFQGLRGGDFACCGVGVEIVDGGEPVGSGGDGVSGLLQESAGVLDVLVEGFSADGEQGGEGGLGDPEPVVQGGGQELVGDGVPGLGAACSGWLQGGEDGDEVVPLAGCPAG